MCYDTVGDIDLLPGEVFHAGAMWICVMHVRYMRVEELLN